MTNKAQIIHKSRVCILGAGVTGLATGLTLTESGIDSVVIEAADGVGGLSRTFNRNGFRFDLGGHRFFSKNETINRFVQDLMGDEMISVNRKSSVYYRGKFYDYPLSLSNVLSNLGSTKSLGVVLSYVWTKVKRAIRRQPMVSVQDWMVHQFGEMLYNIFFGPYTAKLWGLPGHQLSQEWAGQRIRGFSLVKAIKYAFFTRAKNRPKTLIERFTYPEMGIGRISERMAEEIERSNRVFLNSKVSRINHRGGRITSVEVENGNRTLRFHADDFISSIPLTLMLGLMNPASPPRVMEAARQIRFRGLIIIHLTINRERINDQTWIYIQEPTCLISRVHEPKNWSPKLVPEGMTSLVVEIPCSVGDETWARSNHALTQLSIGALEKDIRFLNADEVRDAFVIRLPRAYPIYHIGYEKQISVLLDYVRNFTNLQTVGRAGLHKYVNLDHCLECGILAAKNVMGASYDLGLINTEQEYHEEVAS